MNTQIIYFKFKDFYVPFIALQSIGFRFFAKIMRGSCVFCCSSCISFNLTSYLKHFFVVVVFCKLINGNVFEWFLPIMCKEHTLNRFTNLLSKNHPTLFFCLRREFDWTAYGEPGTCNHLIRNNCPEFRNEHLESYFFKLTLGGDCLELSNWTFAFKTILTQ